MGRKEMKKSQIKVVGAWETVDEILKTRKGIARYGDGEFHSSLGRDIKSQLHDKKLAAKLRHILTSKSDQCLVGIPDIYSGIKALEGTKAHSFWTNMAQRRYCYDLLDPAKQYYSSFITRFDNDATTNCIEYIDHIRKLWVGRKVVLVRGEKIEFCKHPYLLEGADIIGEVLAPNCNAWTDYDRIYKECFKFPKKTLYLIRLGVTATVLAWDLGYHDRQGLDLGHLGMWVNRLLTNNPTASEPEWLNYGKPMGEI